ncbi:MAG: phosphatase PAP2 family protein [Bacteroidaceae bacterium]|jgi:membrane-associated phospholipid phosphatase|nr:phosphatase PAP2 family protein [Bacteroidaceae bacterium]MBQ2459896.1 phosphatase PAP2 family protein [Bacteroidaceae bacterium]MBQ2518510.1 phosphatase PAP2 family protein [Bacteroidaceae bacterium]MBQ3957927.1 phosphatase PAP2 family protein [Bacteroidaceae bacterium]MBQ3991552.1 phosphatase PAP2 family protein [Bacteroidaceae bacterium]
MKSLIVLARILSALFRPTFYPTVGCIFLLTLTYLNMLPWQFKLWVLALVYIFTVTLPVLGTYLYRRARGFSRHELRHQRKRVIPYAIHLCCYLCLMQLMTTLHLPHFFTAIIVVSMLVQCSCLLLNLRWKVSMHSAGSGGIIGALAAYSIIFSFNAVWWLCLAILVSGLVMTSRMLLRQHSLWQVLGGTAVGIVCGYCGVIFM